MFAKVHIAVIQSDQAIDDKGSGTDDQKTQNCALPVAAFEEFPPPAVHMGWLRLRNGHYWRL